jgi:hypothetical protein
MADVAQIEVLAAHEVAEKSRIATAANGLRYAAYGELRIGSDDLLRILEAVPPPLIDALRGHVYCFVPLTLAEQGESSPGAKASAVQIASGYTSDLAERATCHRDVLLEETEYTFISSRLMQDRFALAFELFINIGHQCVDSIGVPREFIDLAWKQAHADVRGETSMDAYAYRRRALGPSVDGEPSSMARRPRSGDDFGAGPINLLTPEEAKQSFIEAAFADALAIYMLSLAMDVDYADLREREYPLLAAPALADRLRLLAQLFPPGSGYEFAIRFRRRP